MKKLFHTLGINLFLFMLSALASLLLLEFGLWIYVSIRPEKAADLFLEPPYAPPIHIDLVASDHRTPISPPPAGRWPWQFDYLNSPYLLFKLLPNQHYASGNVNSLGLRGKEVLREKDSGVFRIIATGGSTAFGMFATSDAAVWTARLEEKLNACGAFSGKVEVLNAGVAAYLSEQELLYLQLELLDLQPNLVIALNGYNDFINPIVASTGCTTELPKYLSDFKHPLYHELAHLLEQHGMERDQNIRSQAGELVRALAFRTHIGKFFYKRLAAFSQTAAASGDGTTADTAGWGEPSTLDGKINPDCIAFTTGEYKKIMRKMARMLNRRRIPLIIAVQPSLYLKKLPSPEEVAAVKDEINQPYYAPAQRIYPLMTRTAEAVAKEFPGTASVDLTDIFGMRSETMYVDDAHLTDLGNDIVAQSLADHICRSAGNFRK